MDEPSRSPYRLDLDNGPVLGIGPDPKTERDSAVSVSLSSGKSSRSHRRTYAWHRACSSGG
jgi:hypothetical protein